MFRSFYSIGSGLLHEHTQASLAGRLQVASSVEEADLVVICAESAESLLAVLTEIPNERPLVIGIHCGSTILDDLVISCALDRRSWVRAYATWNGDENVLGKQVQFTAVGIWKKELLALFDIVPGGGIGWVVYRA